MSRDKGYLYTEDEDEGINQDEEIMHEVEVISASYQVAQKYAKVMGNSKIIINSSSILDIIMEECNIEFKIRHQVLDILAKNDKKPWTDVRKKLYETHSIPRKNIDKLGRLIKIEGDLEHVQKEITTMKGLICRKSLLNEINYFYSLESYCNWVDIPKSSLCFNIGMVLDQYHIFYCGLFFKVVCSSNTDEQTILKQHIIERQIAYGGRYDNQVSHFDVPTRTSNMFAVGVCINVDKIALHLASKDRYTPF